MAKKQDAARKTGKKLTLSKETIRDLTVRKDKAHAVRGGAGQKTTAAYGC